jgi:uncharacterized protein
MNWFKPYEIKEKKGALLRLYAQPGASKTELKGIYRDRIKLSVQAPPVDGAANEAIILYLSKLFGIARKQILMIRGEKSRLKDFWIEGDPERISSILNLLLNVS